MEHGPELDVARLKSSRLDKRLKLCRLSSTHFPHVYVARLKILVDKVITSAVAPEQYYFVRTTRGSVLNPIADDSHGKLSICGSA
jgi:hypothetical protein